MAGSECNDQIRNLTNRNSLQIPQRDSFAALSAETGNPIKCQVQPVTEGLAKEIRTLIAAELPDLSRRDLGHTRWNMLEQNAGEGIDNHV